MNVRNLTLEERTICPSELELDRFHFGELETSQQEAVRAHLDACDACRARLEVRDGGFAPFAVDADQLFAKVASRIETRPTLLDRVRRLLVMPQVFVPVAAAASVAAIFVVQPSEDTIRSKGSVAIEVYRERHGEVEQLSKTAVFETGDRVRFKVSLPAKNDTSQIMVVGVEDSGKTFTYYPTDGSKRSASPRIRPDGALAGAIELDGYAGEEWLHLVHCHRSFELEDLRLKGQRLEAPEECEQASFLMKRR